MSQSIPDVVNAGNFTKTRHHKINPAIQVDNNKFSGPTNVLIIGGSRGIGEGIVLAYAQAGVSSLILATRPSSSKEIAAVAEKAQKINPNAKITSLPVDIASSSSVSALTEHVKSSVGHLDIVVLVSGYGAPPASKMAEEDIKEFQAIFDVNVQGYFLVAHYLVPLLIESGGLKTFIAVGSLAATLTEGVMANTAYAVSKLAQARLVEFLSSQYKDEGLLAVALHPGSVGTVMGKKNTPEMFYPYLIDYVDLCGAYCVWLSREKWMWLSGRLISANWDVDQLLEKKEKIEDQDLLKFCYRVGDASDAALG